MIIVKDSHLDHNLTPEQVRHITELFADRNEFFLETIELPAELGDVPCALHGPATGGAPVPESEVRYALRGARTWESRLVSRSPTRSRLVTVIAGPLEEGDEISHPCVLYTAYGGPLAPQEPGDPDCKDRAASQEFWARHALSETI